MLYISNRKQGEEVEEKIVLTAKKQGKGKQLKCVMRIYNYNAILTRNLTRKTSVQRLEEDINAVEPAKLTR